MDSLFICLSEQKSSVVSRQFPSFVVDLCFDAK